ncbi:MAG: DNA helicase PcrA [Lachnospiraceae bacterium]|nr:DNA helicase PcrA [Lachnospiraceae bacterium]
MISTQMLNKEQQEGVLTTEGPVLILAGAGSGKTRVLTNRTAYLIDEKGVSPYNILAITFTNKAAAEMKSRINEIVGFGSDGVWVSTFHSCCVRILRRYVDRMGYDTAFTIYDTDDQKSLMKDICKRLEIDTKMYKEKMFLNAISAAKNELIDPSDFLARAEGDFKQLKIATVYAEYQKQLLKNNAMDFDDLIMKTVELLSVDNEVREYYQERFHYIMVDEYQDTNRAQFMLIKLLAGKYKNLCVVGDDDQSIYKFRGADISNILDFESIYPNAKVIKLEQNYRSTQNILDAANQVIANNRGRKPKALWTEKEAGDRIVFEQFESASEEAYFIANDIKKSVKQAECNYNDCAVLYRTNAQSRLLEERFVANNIPYKLVGGVNFYARKEIKDILAYLKTIDNGKDDIAVTRILNVPRRGIGMTSQNKVMDYAYNKGISFYDALKEGDRVPGLSRAVGKIRPFVDLIENCRDMLFHNSPVKVLEYLIKETGYVEELEAEGTDEAKARIENIDELITKMVDYEQRADEPTLGEFLEEVALVADIDSYDEDGDYVVLMTLHGAKGLEFPRVYMSGMEDGIFPSYMCITADDPDELEEERRLCYVGITRAKSHLTMTAARTRMIRGETQYNAVSRFVKEIPKELLKGYVKKNSTDNMPRSDTFRKAKQAFKSKPFSATPMQTYNNMQRQGIVLDYKEGDRVSHIKFGEGTVQKIVQGGRDFEVTVDFDQVGVKKMFAMFAKLKKV